MDSSQFAKQLVRRSYELAQDLVDTIYAKIPEPLTGTALVEFLQTHMWREYMIGCHCPAKEMTMLPDSDLDLKMLLASHMVDEYKHYNVFARRARAHGGHGRVLQHQATPEDWALYHATIDYDDIVEIAASVHCSGEVVVQTAFIQMCEPLDGKPKLPPSEIEVIRGEILDDQSYRMGAVVDDRTALDLMEDVIPDEGRHVRIGRLILERYATTEDAQQRAEGVVRRKFEALYAAHGRSIRDSMALLK